MENIPRRIRLDQMIPIEVSICNLVDDIEKLGADIRLTNAINYLWKARESAADFVDNVEI